MLKYGSSMRTVVSLQTFVCFFSIFCILHKLCTDMWIEVCWVESRFWNSEDLNGVLKYGSSMRTLFSLQNSVGFFSIFCILHKLCTDMWIEVCWEESRCLNREDLNGMLKYASYRKTVVSVQIPEGFFSICCI